MSFSTKPPFSGKVPKNKLNDTLERNKNTLPQILTVQTNILFINDYAHLRQISFFCVLGSERRVSWKTARKYRA